MAKDLEGRVFVVTGANTGIGRVTALELAKRGARIVMACRSKEKTDPVIEAIRAETGNDQLSFVPLDLASLASVRDCAKLILAQEPKIHVLLNNAGLAGPRGLTEEGFELAFGVNHLGHFLLTKLLLPRLKECTPSRIVNVASKAHFDAKKFDFDKLRVSTSTITGVPEYEVSKLANVLNTKELARRLEGTGVTCYSLHPGVIASDIWRRIPWPVRPIMKMFMISVEEGALTNLYCATSPEVADESGFYYDKCKQKTPNKMAFDEELAAELWKRSEEWVADFVD